MLLHYKASLPQLHENIPSELKRLDQWVSWCLEKDDSSKLKKVPKNPSTGRNASVTKPSARGPFEKAVDAIRKHSCNGVGFVLTDNDPYTFIDLDHCATKTEKGFKVARWAKDIVHRFDSYTELSPSGTGIRIILKGKIGIKHKKKGDIEVSCNSSYMTLTGKVSRRLDKINERQEELELWYSEVWGDEDGSTDSSSSRQDKESRQSDIEILKKARYGPSGGKFSSLYDNGDWENYDYDSHSEADLGFCVSLTRQTHNPIQIDRIFRTSSLMRSKWDEVHFEDGRTYGEGTIQKALESSFIKKRKRNKNGGPAFVCIDDVLTGQ